MINRIKSICKNVNSEIEHMNSGGCCVFASIITPYLMELGLKPKIRVANWNHKQPMIGSIRKKIDTNDIKQWNSNDVSFGHVVVEVTCNDSKYLVDSKNVMLKTGHIEPTCNMKMMRGELKLNEAVAISSKQSGWNPRFDREQIPRLRALVHSQFTLLKKSIDGTSFSYSVRNARIK